MHVKFHGAETPQVLVATGQQRFQTEIGVLKVDNELLSQELRGLHCSEHGRDAESIGCWRDAMGCTRPTAGSPVWQSETLIGS